jgi:hypothetical protein
MNTVDHHRKAHAALDRAHDYLDLRERHIDPTSAFLTSRPAATSEPIAICRHESFRNAPLGRRPRARDVGPGLPPDRARSAPRRRAQRQTWPPRQARFRHAAESVLTSARVLGFWPAGYEVVHARSSLVRGLPLRPVGSAMVFGHLARQYLGRRCVFRIRARWAAPAAASSSRRSTFGSSLGPSAA